ncbi:sugar porter family MFS transporter [Liquorilactobacillus ghanensis]|uniref:sugar porter family MFS transporter n=1 Tax=Liquorilactobacillus ghanensis TaxID=399370 RepID=UPI0039ED077E
MKEVDKVPSGQQTFNSNKAEKNDRYLIIITAIVTLGGLLFGINTGVINGLLPFMAAKNQLNLSPLLQGIVTSSLTLGAAVGALTTGRFADHYGRKSLLFCLAILFLISNSGCIFAATASWLIGWRFILGLAVGGVSVVVPTYLSEIATPKMRGRMITQNDLMITSGQLLVFCSNALLGNLLAADHNVWRWMMIIGIIPALILLFGMPAVPESPRWLLSKKQPTAALANLTKLRGNSQVAADELQKIQQSVKQLKTVQTWSWKLLKKPAIRKLFLLGIGLGVIQQLIGINVIMYYGTTILIASGFAHQAALIANISNGVISVIASLTGMHLMTCWPRRKMLLLGIKMTTISLGVIDLSALFFNRLTIFPYIVILLVLVFLFFFQSMVSPTTWVIIAEIFPQKLRGLGVGISTFALWLANFGVGLLFPICLHQFGLGLTFFGFFVINLLAYVFTYRLVPETSNRSLEKVQQNI